MKYSLTYAMIMWTCAQNCYFNFITIIMAYIATRGSKDNHKLLLYVLNNYP